MTEFITRIAIPSDQYGIEQLEHIIIKKNNILNNKAAKKFHQWVNDKDGKFIVALSNDVIIGFGKLDKNGSKEWWLGGLRVHPDHQSSGIGGSIYREGLEWLQKNQHGYVRCLTYSNLTPIHKMIAHEGFKHIKSYVLMEKTLPEYRLTQNKRLFRSITPNDFKFIKLKFSRTFFFEKHTTYLIPAKLNILFKQNRIFWWKEKQGLIIINKNQLCFAHTFKPNELKAMLDDIENFMKDSKIISNPNIEQINSFKKTNWVLKHKPIEKWVFEKNLTKSND